MAERGTAMLIAVPLDFESFVDQIYQRSDFTRRYASDPGLAWFSEEGYRAAVVAPLEALTIQARSLGVRVVHNATLSDFASATAECQTLVVFAHWKGPSIAAHDVRIANGSELKKLVLQNGSNRMHRLARTLASCKNDSNRIALKLNAHLAREAKRLVQEAAKRNHGIRVNLHKHAALVEARKALDKIMGNTLAPGERLELADGLYTPEEIERALAPEFDGVLDLTICTSISLASFLDRARGGMFRCVQFENAVTPDIAALMLRQTLATLSSPTALGYLEARSEAIVSVADAIAAQAAEAMKRSVFRINRRRRSL